MSMNFRHEKWSIKEKARLILSLLRERPEMLFDEIFKGDREVPEFIVTFLALLELVHIGLVKVFQTSYKSRDIRLTANFDINGTEAFGEDLPLSTTNGSTHGETAGSDY
jgi:chromatin segregation and condensation protein Rec8/ScpA/Scc1 (kleisin family)